MNKPNIVILLLGIVVIAVCYFIWFSPLFMTIGAIMIIADIACSIHYLFKKNNSVAENTGCLCALLFAVLLIASFFMGGGYKISSFGGKRHFYDDCKFIESAHTHDVGKMSALLWGCFDDCESCKNRKEQEIIKEREKRKEQKKKESLDFIDQQIMELEEVRNAILNGKDVDTDDYRFRYEVEDEIRESVIEDMQEYEPRGRR